MSRLASLILVLTMGVAALRAADPAELAQQGQRWLLAQQQDNGAFLQGDQFTVGVTALVVDALCSGPSGLAADDPAIAKALAWLKTHQQPDGGIYLPQEGLATYVTSLSLMAMASAGDEDQATRDQAVRFLLGTQNTDVDTPQVGGWSYGKPGDGKEDLSNTAYALEALRASGLPADHEALQRAEAFLQRCQNLSSVNDQADADNDGSGRYAPVSRAPSGVGGEASGSGSGGMTYNLIKSYIYIGLEPGDPRLDAALAWVRDHYVFDRNPGLPEGMERAGRFYYLGVMAKTLTLIGADTLALPDGSEADWRADLTAALADEAQQVEVDDGPAAMWINDDRTWGEGLPQIVTGYVVKALARIQSAD